MKKYVIIALCLSLIGCASAMSKLQVKPWSEPQYGMTRQQMFDLLGKPESFEVYKKTDQTLVEYYFYVRNSESTQEKVPVCVIDKKIVGWGKTYYEDHISPDDIRIK